MSDAQLRELARGEDPDAYLLALARAGHTFAPWREVAGRPLPRARQAIREAVYRWPPRLPCRWPHASWVRVERLYDTELFSPAGRPAVQAVVE